MFYYYQCLANNQSSLFVSVFKASQEGGMAICKDYFKINDKN